MKINFKGDYKSLSSFESEELAPFTVITGKNGSGKSQLINLFQLRNEQQLKLPSELILIPELTQIQIEGIETIESLTVDSGYWKSSIGLYVDKYRNWHPTMKNLCYYFSIQKIICSEIRGNWESFISKLELDGVLLIFEYIKTHNPHFFNVNRNYTVSSVDNNRLLLNEFLSVLHQFEDNTTDKTIKLTEFVANHVNKHFFDLFESDFYRTPITSELIENLNLFNSRLDTTFYNYSRRRHQNDYNFYRKEKYNDSNESISDFEFLAHFTPPWEIINQIFESHNIPFKFNGIENKDFSPDARIDFPLIKQSSGTSILMTDLSTGEKLIISLVIRLFTSNYYSEHLKYPELIILDEPDAHLHPEMSKLLIDVLNETFVKQLGIRVIITTHSPSTVALCPEDSLFVLENEPTTSLSKIDKDEALKMLTSFIPTLSIDYKNHRQVFVESPTDMKYYELIYTNVSNEYSNHSKLYFMTNAMGKGNCDLVKTVVKSLRNSGLNTAYGIIDWDTTNSNMNDEFVFVHGENERYSLENYAYDPLYLVVLFMKYKSHQIHTIIGVTEGYNEYSIGQKSNEELQAIVNWFFEEYYSKFPAQKPSIKEDKTVHFSNGKSVNLPIWYVTMKGHDIEIKLREVFPSLNKFIGEGVLQAEMTLIISKCYPFVPLESKELIERLITG